MCVFYVVVTSKTTQKPKKCEGVKVHDKLYKGRIRANGIKRPYQLGIYKDQIFFSYNIGEDTQDTFMIAYVKKETRPTNVSQIANGFALAIDHSNAKVYFGGSKGIYSANVTNLDEIEYIESDHDIWDLFYHKHHLYFIQYPEQRLYKYNIKEKKAVLHEIITGKIYQFVIDGEDDIFFTTKDGLFEIKNSTSAAIAYSGPKLFRALEVNNKGVAHFCAQHNIYVPNKNNHSLIEIASIKHIFGLTFNAHDNIIYSNPHEIIELEPHDCK